MPVININWLKGRTKEQKAKIAEEIEKVMLTHGNCKPGSTYINFTDFDKDNWAVNGKLMSEL